MQSQDVNNWMLARRNIRNDDGVEVAPTESNHSACREFLVQYGHVVPGVAEIPRDLYAMSLFELRNTLTAVEAAPVQLPPKQSANDVWTSRSHTITDAAEHDAPIDAARESLAVAKRCFAIDAFNLEKEPTVYYKDTNRIDHLATENARKAWQADREIRRAQIVQTEKLDENVVIYTGQRINHAKTEVARAHARQKNKENGLG